MSKPLPTAIVGFGRMAAGYAADPVMARHYPYASHAQVLRAHPAFDWQAVVDPDPAARALATDLWNVPRAAATVEDLGETAADIELAVLATAPDARLGMLDAFPNLRAVLVEKPLGNTLAASQAFLDACARRNVMVAVNLWRRADEGLRALADGALHELVGDLRGGVAVYGNGLHNNGTHMIDMVRMLCGEPTGASLTGADRGFREGPIPGDLNPQFSLTLESGCAIAFQPVRFAEYRENGLILWGEHGRLEIMNEGLSVVRYGRTENRAMSGEREIAFDAPVSLGTTVGHALYAMYDNLAAAVVAGDAALIASGGASALRTARIVDAVAHLEPAARHVALASPA